MKTTITKTTITTQGVTYVIGFAIRKIKHDNLK